MPRALQHICAGGMIERSRKDKAKPCEHILALAELLGMLCVEEEEKAEEERERRKKKVQKEENKKRRQSRKS